MAAVDRLADAGVEAGLEKNILNKVVYYVDYRVYSVGIG